jgi:hypothetical protein
MLCIAVTTPPPTCVQWAPATDTTCDGLASAFGISPNQFFWYNDDVNADCTNLVVNHSVRVFLL